MKQTSKDAIFLAAMESFQKSGYKGTNIRDLAVKADVSLGLINHYFKSKRNLAYVVLEVLIQYAMCKTKDYLAKENKEDALLYDALATRVVNTYLSHGDFRTFYLDTLSEDIFFHYLENHSQLLLQTLQNKYHYNVSEDKALLYSRYVPYIIEKTLFLKKQDGLFHSISEEDIPFEIFQSTYTGKIPQNIIETCDKMARRLAPTILKTMSSIPSYEELQNMSLLPLH